MDSMAPVLRKLHSFTGPVESVFISRQSATVIVEAGDSLSTPHGTIGAVADVLAVRITADGRHWIAALELEDGRHVVIVDGREVASYGRIHRSCAAISGDGARWAVFADTGRGERCLVIDGTVYGPFLDCPPGTGFNARPLVFDGQNALWCPVKTAEDEWALSRDGEIASEARQLWRDVGFQSGSLRCRSRKDGKWFVHAGDREWGPFDSAHEPRVSGNGEHVAFAARDDDGDCVVLNGKVIHRDHAVMMHVHVTDEGRVLASTAGKAVDVDFESFYQPGERFDENGYRRAVEAHAAAVAEAELTTQIHFGDWASERFEDCAALAVSGNGRHIAFVASRGGASFVGSQHRLWGGFDSVLHMAPLALNDGRVAWMNDCQDGAALLVDGDEVLRVDVCYGELREVDGGIGFAATRGDEVFWISVG